MVDKMALILVHFSQFSKNSKSINLLNVIKYKSIVPLPPLIVISNFSLIKVSPRNIQNVLIKRLLKQSLNYIERLHYTHTQK